MTQKNSFILYHSLEPQLLMLSDEQAGRLIKALFAHVIRGEEPPETEDGMVKMCYAFVANQIKLDTEKYEQTCLNRSISGKKGGRPKNRPEPKETKCPDGKQNEAKKADNENDDEYEYEYVNENEKENKNEKDAGIESKASQDRPSDQQSVSFKNDFNKKEYAPAVHLTEEQYKLLADTYGKDKTARLIEILSEYKISNGKSYSSDYHAITAWVVKKLERIERENETSASSLDTFDLDSLIENS